MRKQRGAINNRQPIDRQLLDTQLNKTQNDINIIMSERGCKRYDFSIIKRLVKYKTENMFV